MLGWMKKIIQTNDNLPNDNLGQKEKCQLVANGSMPTRKASVDSCESVSESQTIGEDKFTCRRIAQVDTYDDQFVFMTGTDGEEFRVPRCQIREPMFGCYYQFDGTFVRNGVFEPISVMVLANDSKALLDARAKLWVQMFGDGECSAEILAELGIDSLVKKIFNSTEEKETENPAVYQIQQVSQHKQRSKMEKNEPTVKREPIVSVSANNNTRNENAAPCSSSATAKRLIPKVVCAVALRIDRCGNVFMTSPQLAPLFRITRQSVNVPLRIGKCYSLTNLSKLMGAVNGDKCETDIFKVGEATNESKSGPFRTHVANGTVQLFAEVMRTDRTENGNAVYRSDSISMVLDGGGFLNRFMDAKNEEPAIRHAPEPKYGVWCSLRKYPVGGIHWKIVRVDPESRPKEVVSNKEKPKSPPRALATATHSSPIRNAPKEEEEGELLDGLLDGLICSQNKTHFLVYSPGHQWLARLDKRQCGGGNNSTMLGMWIQCLVRDKSGTKFVEKGFTYTSHKILATPTQDYVLVRTRLQIPRELETSETPWCEELRTNVTFKDEVLKHKYYGKTVLATIGCPSQMSSENSDSVQWLLLNVED